MYAMRIQIVKPVSIYWSKAWYSFNMSVSKSLVLGPDSLHPPCLWIGARSSVAARGVVEGAQWKWQPLMAPRLPPQARRRRGSSSSGSYQPTVRREAPGPRPFGDEPAGARAGHHHGSGRLDRLHAVPLPVVLLTQIQWFHDLKPFFSAIQPRRNVMNSMRIRSLSSVNLVATTIMRPCLLEKPLRIQVHGGCHLGNLW